MVPGDLRYTKDHEWVRIDGDEAVVGITQFAADQLGDIVFVELPAVGRALDAHATFGVVESVKAVSDLFAPVAGEVTASNDALAGTPGARQQRPLRRGLDAPGAARRRRARSRRCSTRPPTSSSSPRADPMPYGPHAADDRARMLEAIGIDSVDALFEDIPEALRAGPPARSTSPEPELDCSPPASRPSPRATASTSRPSWAPAPTATGRRRSWTRCCSAASGTRPTRPTSPR